MGDPLSATAAVLSLPGIFMSCVQCFELIQTARNRGRDLLIMQNQFSNQRVRFTKWGEACGFGSEGGYDRRLDDPSLRSNILNTMQSLQMLLDDGAAIVQKHSSGNEKTIVAIHTRSGASRWSWTVIKTRLRKGAKESKDGFAWSIEEKAALEAHITSLYRLIGDLERFTNYLGIPARQRELVQYEIESIHDPSVLEVIQESAIAGDDVVSEIASIRLSSLRSPARRTGVLSSLSSFRRTVASSYRTAPEDATHIEDPFDEMPPEGIHDEGRSERIVRQLIAASIFHGRHSQQSISELIISSISSESWNESIITDFVASSLSDGGKYEDIIGEVVAPFIPELTPQSVLSYRHPYGRSIRNVIAPSVSNDGQYERIIRYLVASVIQPKPPESSLPVEGQNERIIRELIASSSATLESQLRSMDVSRSGDLIGSMDFTNFDAAMTNHWTRRGTAMDTPLAPGAKKRVMGEFRRPLDIAGIAERRKNGSAWMNIHPIADSLRFFLCTFEGPPSTPYADGLFHFVLCVADTYPFRPPVCRAVTRIYHPNINAQGEICISLFQVGEHTDWATWGQLNTSTVGIASILDDPGLNDPLVPEIAELYIRDRQEYEKNVKRYTELYAKPDALFNEEGYERCFRMCCDAAQELKIRQDAESNSANA